MLQKPGNSGNIFIMLYIVGFYVHTSRQNYLYKHFENGKLNEIKKSSYWKNKWENFLKKFLESVDVYIIEIHNFPGAEKKYNGTVV